MKLDFIAFPCVIRRLCLDANIEHDNRRDGDSLMLEKVIDISGSVFWQNPRSTQSMLEMNK